MVIMCVFNYVILQCNLCVAKAPFKTTPSGDNSELDYKSSTTPFK